MTRLLYLDEAGTGDPAREPYVVVAGPLVHADSEWKRLEQYLGSLADVHAPAEARDEFVFHATEIFSGGKVFPRDKFPRERRWPILDDLVSIPGKFQLPLVVGFAERAETFPTVSDDIKSEAHLTACLQSAFMMCMMQVERVMREFMEDEVCMVVMEASKPRLHAAYIAFQHQLKSQDLAKQMPGVDIEGNFLPLRHIIENPNFSPKTDSSPLQVADTCAFAIKRHLMRTPDSQRWYRPIAEWLVMRPRQDVDLEPNERGE